MLEAVAALVKFLLYAGVLTSSGVILAEASLKPEGFARHGLPMARIAAAVTLVAAVLNVLVLFLRLGGSLDEPTLAAVRESPVGLAAALQLSGAGLLIAFAGRRPPFGWASLAGAAALLASFAVNGHSASAGPPQGALAFLHVAAAAWWLGALLLLHSACERLDREALAASVVRFSRIALGVVVALIAAGGALIVSLVDFGRVGWFTGYAQVLAVKVAFAGTVLALAAFNKLSLTPRLRNADGRAAQSLRRSIAFEIAVIGAVLAATAILTTYTSPHD